MRKNIPFIILYVVVLTAVITLLVAATNAFVTQTTEETYANMCASMPIFVHLGQTATLTIGIISLIVVYLFTIFLIVEAIIYFVIWRKDNANT